MATKKKEELAQEEMPLTLDAEMPLDGQENFGPLEGEDMAGLSAADADEQFGDAVPATDETANVGDEFVCGSDELTADPETDGSGANAEPAAAGILLAREQILVPMPERPVEETAAAEIPPTEPPTPAKPKRAPRKKKAAAKSEQQTETVVPPVGSSAEQEPKSAAAASTGTTSASRPRPARKARPAILTIENGSVVETEADREDVIWHEIHNAYRVRRVLPGLFCGVEQHDGKTTALVDYKGFRVLIPLREMLIELGDRLTGKEYQHEMDRLNRLLGNMLGAEIDFVVRGIDSHDRSVVGSRRDAMLRKRQTFYFGTDTSGEYRIHEGRIVQARVIAVAEKVIRVEVFGVECSIPARDLSWEWLGDAHERYAVGDKILVRVQSIQRDSVEDVRITADVRSLTPNAGREALARCRLQSKYIGKITDVRRGVVFIRLTNGANAVAHSCFDYRTPGKGDDVGFVVTAIDEERCVASGIITRIIRQNL